MVKEYCAMAIVVYGNKILYTNETVGDNQRISLPKGHMEDGETKIETAIRECEEETGVVLTKDQALKELLPLVYRFNNPFENMRDTLKTVYPIIFSIEDPQVPLITEPNINEAGFKEINELINILTFDNVRDLVKQVKKYLHL